MGKFNFCGASYESQSLTVDAQKLVNWYVEQIESGDGNTRFALYPSPGTKQFIELIPPAPPVTAAGLQNVRIFLTSDQINAANLSGVPIVFIPAPGPNLMVVPVSFVCQYHFVTTAYANGVALELGWGDNETDILLTRTMFQHQANFRQTYDTTEYGIALSTAQTNTPDKYINQPISCVMSFAPSAGDGTCTTHIQYYVLNVVTGQIVNGQPKRVHCQKTDITTAQYKAGLATPISVVPAPGNPNQMIVPLDLVLWNHFNTAGLSAASGQLGFYGSPPLSVSGIDFQALDPGGWTAAGDRVQQVGFNRLSLLEHTSNIVNQPISLQNADGVAAGATGDTTGTVFVTYLVIDTVTGELVQGTGDYYNTLTEVTAAEIKAAGITQATPIVPAPGNNLLNVARYQVARSHFNGTAYTAGNGGISKPFMSPFPPAPPYPPDLSYMFYAQNFPGANFLEQTADCTALAQAIFYNSLNSTPAVRFNQPISWKDQHDLSASTGNTTVTVNTGFVVLNVNDGTLKAG